MLPAAVISRGSPHREPHLLGLMLHVASGGEPPAVEASDGRWDAAMGLRGVISTKVYG